ncbi:tripartite tricarboxylate transporter permease, partial [Candidatus Woesearchaeota archaeon]|nr:tripartite tricarboxylate transporter permease [Candidatus Woesearchaeota archaeon]
MFWEIAVVLALGVVIGIFTGIIPGIHVNLVATTLFALSPLLLNYFEPLSLAVFIISLSVTHSFLDTIPSIYLGAPENENALSVLPGQKMLLKGEGYQAVKITILGTYIGMIVAIMLIPLFILIANKIYPLLKPYLIYLLIVLMAYMILKEKNRFWSFFLFLLSGTLGIIVFSIPNLNEPLFPLLSGLFGVSGLCISYFENTKIPSQSITKKIDLKIKELIKAIFGSSIAVFLIQFFPGLGPAQGAVISNQVVRDVKNKGYLALVGAMGTMSVVFSLVTFYTLNKAKDGTIVVISKLLEIDFSSFLILVFVFLIAGSIAVFLTLFFSKIFSKLIVKVNYKMLVISIIVFIFLMSVFLNGPIGILVLLTSTAIGLIAPLKNIGRNHAMGCLILPVILY